LVWLHVSNAALGGNAASLAPRADNILTMAAIFSARPSGLCQFHPALCSQLRSGLSLSRRKDLLNDAL